MIRGFGVSSLTKTWSVELSRFGCIKIQDYLCRLSRQPVGSVECLPVSQDEIRTVSLSSPSSVKGPQVGDWFEIGVDRGD